MISFGCSLAIILSALLVSFLSSHGFDALLKALHLPANFNLHSFNSFLVLTIKYLLFRTTLLTFVTIL